MIIASYVAFLQVNNFYINLILVICEPTGWFLLWIGLDHLIVSKGKAGGAFFYRMIAKVRVEFIHIKSEFKSRA